MQLYLEFRTIILLVQASSLWVSDVKFWTGGIGSRDMVFEDEGLVLPG